MTFRYLGHGVGLRVPHYERALGGALGVDWVEVITENFLGSGGRPRAVLEAVRREKPLVFHGVSLGVGSLGGPDFDYLGRVKALADSYEPAWVSDHVCWSRLGRRQSHELLPLPFDEEALAVVVEHTRRVQDFLGRPILLENVSSYIGFQASEMTEWEFLAELARRSGCALLVDLNNVLVNAHNHGFSPADYLAGLPPQAVAQFHLANHTRRERYRFDDHRGPVPAEVWALFEAAVRRFGPVSSLVEWDEDIPPWDDLAAEAGQARARERAVLEALAREVMARPAPADEADRVDERAGVRWSNGAVAHAIEGVPRLERRQQLFFEALLWPRGVADYVAAAGEEKRAELESTFLGDASLGALERLDIYANGYFYRLLDVLRDLFPRVATLAGPAGFNDLVTDYVLEHPSTAPDLRHLGDALPAFIARHPIARPIPVLEELAHLELALGRALHAADAEPLTRAALARFLVADWPALELRLVPSASLLAAHHDLARVAELCDGGEGGELEAARSSPHREASFRVLVARRGHSAYFRPLDTLEALALERFAAGNTFEAVCDALGSAEADGALRGQLLLEQQLGERQLGERLLGYLQRWLDDGLVSQASVR